MMIGRLDFFSKGIIFINSTHWAQQPNSTSLTLIGKIKVIVEKAFWIVAAIFDPFISFFGTQPLADALALKTFTHGTNCLNYLDIRCSGVNPKKGGNTTGSTAGTGIIYKKNPYFEKELKRSLSECEGHFYLFKDMDDFNDSSSDKYYVRSLLPMRHAVLSGIAMMAPREARGQKETFLRIIGAASSIFTPTISFRFDPKDLILKTIEIDPDFPNVAYRTKTALSIDYIGIRSIVKQGFKSDVLNRISNSPKKAALGFIRLINPIGLAIIFYVFARVVFEKAKSF